MAGFAMKPLITKNVCFLGDWSRVRFFIEECSIYVYTSTSSDARKSSDKVKVIGLP